MRYLARLGLVPLIGCSLPAPSPPSAEFLVADASSTYWVRSGPRGISARTSPLILTSAGNRFYEVYVDDVTRSYDDAFFAREPIYRRDLLTGERKLLFEETRVSAWEKEYLASNPDAHLLDPDEDGSDDVSVAASGEIDIVGIAGPYVLYNRRATLERGDFQQTDSAHGAIDISSGESVTLAVVARDIATPGTGGVREGDQVRWRHAGYDVIARWDPEREETHVILRDLRKHEWPLGIVDTRVPRLFWLDSPRVDGKLRSALSGAFEDARSEDIETQLVRRGQPARRAAMRPIRVAKGTAAGGGRQVFQ